MKLCFVVDLNKWWQLRLDAEGIGKGFQELNQNNVYESFVFTIFKSVDDDWYIHHQKSNLKFTQKYI